MIGAGGEDSLENSARRIRQGEGRFCDEHSRCRDSWRFAGNAAAGTRVTVVGRARVGAKVAAGCLRALLPLASGDCLTSLGFTRSIDADQENVGQYSFCKEAGAQ